MKTDFLEWQDVRGRDALTALARIKANLAAYHHVLKRVYVVKSVAQGYVFAVEYKARWYGLVNPYDFDQALATEPIIPDYEHNSAFVLGVPISTNQDQALRVMGGIFTLVVRVGSRSYT